MTLHELTPRGRAFPRRRLLAAAAALLAMPWAAWGAAPAWRYDRLRNAAIFDRVWREVARRYWDPALAGIDWGAARARFRPGALAATDAAGLYAAIGAMLDLVGDSHLFVVDAARSRLDEARQSGEAMAGFGFSAWEAGGAWRIYAVDAGTPAARAGMAIGWQLVAVDGRAPDLGWHPAAGERTTVTIVDDGGRTRSVALVAEPLPVAPPWRATMLEGGVLLLRLDVFDSASARWLRDALAARRPAAVILDLRENGGGEAISVARAAGSLFAEKRVLLRRVGRRRAEDVPVLGAGRSSWRGPLAVLIGPRSASGAEALAALVAESGRGVTLGERSAGALTGAVELRLADGGMFSLAEYDIRTAAGTRIEAAGLAPMVPVRPTLAEARRGDDVVVARALALLAPRPRSLSSVPAR